MKTILILEDNEERIAAFQEAVSTLGTEYELKVWRDAPAMMAECEKYFATAALISLDHGLNRGTGLDVATFLGDFAAACPVLIHSANVDRTFSMENELRFAGWLVNHVTPAGPKWIETSWLEVARESVTNHSNTWAANLPDDHAARVERMQLSLDGLGLGDALGQMLCYRAEVAPARIARNEVPGSPWFHTDDTEMAISICAVLKSHGHIDQDALSKRFVRRFERNPDRGYGRMTRIQLREISAGAKWQFTAANAFGGQGSLGNGSAMRVAPLGAYFADDLVRCAEEAKASSLVTHTHPEAVAGAVAVAVAAALAWQLKTEPADSRAKTIFDEVLAHTPESRVRRGIQIASTIPSETPAIEVARVLGNGSMITAADTVPFCIWMAACHGGRFTEAIGTTIGVDGDCDTNAAIVGGIVALSAGREGIPMEWMEAREKVRI